MARNTEYRFGATPSAALASLTAEAIATNRRTKHQRERGDTLVELVLILPVLVLILLSILDFGRAVYAYHVVANCAREGARYGVGVENDPSAIIAVVKNAAIGLDASQLTVTVTYPTTDTLRVEVTYPFRVITPLVAWTIGNQSVMLHSTTTMYRGY